MKKIIKYLRSLVCPQTPRKAIGFMVGDKVRVYDRYRFASRPLVVGTILRCATIYPENGVEIDISSSDNPAAKKLGRGWFSLGQIRHVEGHESVGSPAEITRKAMLKITGVDVPLDCFTEEGHLISQKFADYVSAKLEEDPDYAR